MRSHLQDAGPQYGRGYSTVAAHRPGSTSSAHQPKVGMLCRSHRKRPVLEPILRAAHPFAETEGETDGWVVPGVRTGDLLATQKPLRQPWWQHLDWLGSAPDEDPHPEATRPKSPPCMQATLPPFTAQTRFGLAEPYRTGRKAASTPRGQRRVSPRQPSRVPAVVADVGPVDAGPADADPAREEDTRPPWQSRLSPKQAKRVPAALTDVGAEPMGAGLARAGDKEDGLAPCRSWDEEDGPMSEALRRAQWDAASSIASRYANPLEQLKAQQAAWRRNHDALVRRKRETLAEAAHDHSGGAGSAPAAADEADGIAHAARSQLSPVARGSRPASMMRSRSKGSCGTARSLSSSRNLAGLYEVQSFHPPSAHEAGAGGAEAPEGVEQAEPGADAGEASTSADAYSVMADTDFWAPFRERVRESSKERVFAPDGADSEGGLQGPPADPLEFELEHALMRSQKLPSWPGTCQAA